MSRPTYSPDSSVICKNCKQMHDFFDLRDIYKNPVLFPKGDLSVYRVVCPKDEKYYDYEEHEVLRPIVEKSEVAKRVDALEKRIERFEKATSADRLYPIENRLSLMEMRLAKLESGEWIQQQKNELKDFVTDFLSKQSTKPQEQPKKVLPYQ